MCTRKTRILEVVYNASNNELVRTNTLVKGCIVMIDATPFRKWYAQHYGENLGKETKPVKLSKTDAAKAAQRAATKVLDPKFAEQFKVGRLMACISSRPGQDGRADGYLLEGKELEFYQRKTAKKK